MFKDFSRESLKRTHAFFPNKEYCINERIYAHEDSNLDGCVVLQSCSSHCVSFSQEDQQEQKDQDTQGFQCFSCPFVVVVYLVAMTRLNVRTRGKC